MKNTKNGYQVPSQNDMIQTLMSEHMQSLRMVQQDELIRIKNDHHRKGYICPAEASYLESLFIDVVLNGKGYNSVQAVNKRTIPQYVATSHIGMQTALRMGYQPQI